MAPAEVAAVELGEGGRSLVILDNCEHLIAECAEFVGTVLGASVDVSVLATSREQLGVAGEVAWRVPSLPSPPRDALVPVETLSQYDAVNLFVDRARRARPSFTVNEANAAADRPGLPPSGRHPVGGGAGRGPLSTPEHRADRQRAGRPLPPADRRIADGDAASADAWRPRWSGATTCSTTSSGGCCDGSACSPGPSRLLGAEVVVTAPGDVDPIAVFDTISRLVDKSLVLADDPDGESPYRLLETIRAFAVDRARDAGELTDTARHPLARGGAPGSTGSGSPVRPTTSIALVDANHDDLVAALSWAAGSGHRARSPAAVAAGPSVHGNRDAPATRCRHSTCSLTPAVEQQHPRLWLRAAVCRGDPRSRISRPGGLQRAGVALRDAGSRTGRRIPPSGRRGGCWGCRSPPTGSCCGRRASMTSRSPSRWPRSGWPSMPPSTNPRAHARRCSRLTPSRPRIPAGTSDDYARAADGMQELVFGDLAAAIAAGYELVDSATRPMQEHGYRLLLIGGLLGRDEAAVAAAMEAARTRRSPAGPRFRSARRAPRSTSTTSCATSQRNPARRCRRRSIHGWIHATPSIAATWRRPGRSSSRFAPAGHEAGHGPRHHRSPRPAVRTTGTMPCGSPTNTGSA